VFMDFPLSLSVVFCAHRDAAASYETTVVRDYSCFALLFPVSQSGLVHRSAGPEVSPQKNNRGTCR
jgi:hypothetical protein